MTRQVKIDDRISVGGQPTLCDLIRLARDGCRSVVNLRTTTSDDERLRPDQEAARVSEHGMSFVHLPVDPATLDRSTLDRIGRQLEALASPVFVHCEDGQLAAALMLLYQGLGAGMRAPAICGRAEQLGVPLTHEPVRSFVHKIAWS
jgi:uncharacterized protein (TIGR01244 family)